jgi:hypothetical protein
MYLHDCLKEEARILGIAEGPSGPWMKSSNSLGSKRSIEIFCGRDGHLQHLLGHSPGKKPSEQSIHSVLPRDEQHRAEFRHLTPWTRGSVHDILAGCSVDCPPTARGILSATGGSLRQGSQYKLRPSNW